MDSLNERRIVIVVVISVFVVVIGNGHSRLGENRIACTDHIALVAEQDNTRIEMPLRVAVVIVRAGIKEQRDRLTQALPCLTSGGQERVVGLDDSGPWREQLGGVPGRGVCCRDCHGPGWIMRSRTVLRDGSE